jgi:hypothetical protein
LYYKEVQRIPKGEHGRSLENAKRIDLDRWRQTDGVMGTRRYQAGMNLKRKRAWSSWSEVAPKQRQTGNWE